VYLVYIYLYKKHMLTKVKASFY